MSLYLERALALRDKEGVIDGRGVSSRHWERRNGLFTKPLGWENRALQAS